MKRVFFASLMVILLATMMFAYRTNALTDTLHPQSCDTCLSTWTFRGTQTFYFSCPGFDPCPCIWSYDLWSRVCNGVYEIQITGLHQGACFGIDPNCFPTCPMAQIIAGAYAHAMKQNVMGFPPRLDTTGVDSCKTWKISMASCWRSELISNGNFIIESFWPCSDSCCWKKYKVCRLDSTHRVYTPKDSSNHQPICPDSVSYCESACEAIHWIDTMLASRTTGEVPASMSKNRTPGINRVMKNSSVHPNPASKTVTILYYSLNRGGAQIRVTDMRGNTVGYMTQPVDKPGDYQVNMPVGTLPKGRYFYDILLDGRSIASGWFGVIH